MIFVSITNRVWVASGNTIISFSAQVCIFLTNFSKKKAKYEIG